MRLSSKKLPAIRIALSLFLIGVLLSCSDDKDPDVYGNDGASLYAVNIGAASALVSVLDYSRSYDYEGRVSIWQEELFHAEQGSLGSKVDFVIHGTPSGGFDHYIVNDIDENYFLITFYLRRESYFVNKVSGLAVRSAFVEAQDLTNDDSQNFMIDDDQDDFYYKDLDGSVIKVDNFLGDHPVSSMMPIDYSASLYEGTNDDLYSFKSNELYYHEGNSASFITDNCAAVWNDGNGGLRVMAFSGEIFTVTGNQLEKIDELGFPLQETFKVRTLRLTDENLTVAILQDANTSAIYLFDLSGMTPLKDITATTSMWYVEAMDIANKLIYLMGDTDDGRRIIAIDAASLFYSHDVIDPPIPAEMIVYAMDPSNGTVYLGVCESIGSAGCVSKTKAFSQSAVSTLVERKVKVIKL
jgi:hypothetical protein